MTKVFILSLVLLVSCSTVKFQPTGKKFAPLQNWDSVFILTPGENVPSDAIEIGKWEQVEDWNFTWERLAGKLKAKAKSVGATVIKIEEYFEGSKTKGHAALLRGQFYSVSDTKNMEAFVNEERNKNTAGCNCSIIHVFRDEGNAALRTLFKIQVVVNDSLYGDLRNKGMYNIKLTEVQDVFIGTSNEKKLILKNELGKEYYVQATQNMGSGSAPGMITVSVGSKMFFVVNSLIGKIHFETLEKNSR